MGTSAELTQRDRKNVTTGPGTKLPAQPISRASQVAKEDHHISGTMPRPETFMAPTDDRHPKLGPKDLKQIRDLYGTETVNKIVERTESLKMRISEAREALRTFDEKSKQESFLVKLACYVIPKAWLNQGRARLESQISKAVRDLRQYHEHEIKSVTDKISNKYRGATFNVPLPDSQRARHPMTSVTMPPKALMLASIPTEKKDTILTFDQFSDRMRSLRPENCALAKMRPSNDRVILTRKNDQGKVDKLEFSYRREGLVDVILNGVVMGKAWTDDAVKIAEGFARNKDMEKKITTKNYDSYTVR